MWSWRRTCLALALLAVAAPASAQTCTPLGQATFVRDTLQERYLWYRDLPDLDPAAVSGPEAYLDAVRVRPVDLGFSYITSRAADDAFYSDSQFVGLGLSTAIVHGELRVLQVFADGPAAEAGLDRGARIDTLGGVPGDVVIAADGLDAALGPAEVGWPVTLAWTSRDGRPGTATLRKRAVTIPTVSLTRTFEVAGRRVGYLFFRNFVRPSVAALDEAFAALQEARVDDLVVDLRYNGGGLVSVAGHLASLIGGPSLRDQVFAQSTHNDRNRRMDETLRFGGAAAALRLTRLVVITTRATASASELVINGLTPFLPVVVIGERTYGKPVGQYAVPFCDKVFAPVAFAMVNAAGAGGYFEGLPVTCGAADDIAHELGDPREASLAAALDYVSTGTCPAATSVSTLARAAAWSGTAGRRPGPLPQGWPALLNAR